MPIIVQRMADALVHRGPDDAGTWVDLDARIALGHRRLSVVDLSPTGHQPMVSASGRTVIAYNGEVYNHRELRAELEAVGTRFRGNSDTEVIVEACERWGIEPTCTRLIGMFVFALWDRTDRTLRLVRDRLGIKPLYWGIFDETLVFGSELSAFRAHPSFRPDIDRQALAVYLRRNYVPAPHSIYKGVRKLRQGTILTCVENGTPSETIFWSLRDVARRGVASRSTLADAEAEQHLDALLRDAVGRRMVADVPLGAFLSGGIDSSTVVALMQAQSRRPIKTFAIGFPEVAFDEGRYAKAVAAHLGTDHTELYVQPADSLAVVPRLAHIYDEPLADSSQIPTFLVSALAREQVTVALSGDGGDEVFSGYDRYLRGESIWRRIAVVPAPLRQATSQVLRALPARQWDAMTRWAPAAVRCRASAGNLHRLAAALPGGVNDFYQQYVSTWFGQLPVVTGVSAATLLEPSWADTVSEDAIEQFQYLDTMTYLPDDILAKVDRASMAVSLEARVPLIDHRVIEFVWTLPNRFLMRDGQTKWLLRRVLDRYVPKHLIERPKMGFGVPLDAWLRGPLREWADSLLDTRRLTEEGFFDSTLVRRFWTEHLAGSRNHQQQLWSVLMFQAWLDAQRSWRS